jgi:hypothetical protein
MSGDDIHRELEQLRAEVSALSAARANKKAPVETTPEESTTPEAEQLNDIIGQTKAAVEDDEELKGQFDQLFEQFEKEIKDLPAITTLAVFSLGVLFGRLLR